jgi:hypothetical protein
LAGAISLYFNYAPVSEHECNGSGAAHGIIHFILCLAMQLLIGEHHGLAKGLLRLGQEMGAVEQVLRNLSAYV